MFVCGNLKELHKFLETPFFKSVNSHSSLHRTECGRNDGVWLPEGGVIKDTAASIKLSLWWLLLWRGCGIRCKDTQAAYSKAMWIIEIEAPANSRGKKLSPGAVSVSIKPPGDHSPCQHLDATSRESLS